MIRSIPPQEGSRTLLESAGARRRIGFGCALFLNSIGFISLVLPGAAQITVNTHTGAVTNNSDGSSVATVDRRYQQIKPTSVPLSNTQLDPKTRLELIRVLEAEQGFAMRPLPRGHKGLTLAANGNLEPAGEAYLNMVTNEGISAKPGDRVVLTDLKIDHSKIIIDLNGGPDPKHRFLRHVEIGTGPVMNPAVRDDGQEPVGSRVTITFKEHVPEITGSEVKALLAPLISFDVKTPVQAFTDTLPTKLKDAILNHQVLVGMSTDMLLFAKGAPENKSREMDGQMPFEEWIYGKPPNEVDFVRINGNRVIRVEVAKMGVPPVIFTKDEVEGLMRTDGTSLEPEKTQRVAKMGDVQRDPDKEAAAPPPTLRAPGEKLPTDDEKAQQGQEGEMKPVHFPKPKADPLPGANPDGEPDSAQPTPSTQPSTSSQPANPSPPPASAPTPAQPQMWQPATGAVLR